MTVSQKIKNYLTKEKVSFEVLEHPLAYTALEIASAQHVPGRKLIKSVIVHVDDKFIMCVLPAIHYLDLDKLKTFLKAKKIELARESEISKIFPEYEVGAEPPFGNLYGLSVVLDKFLEEDEEVTFNAGTHTDMIRLKLKDYVRLVKPLKAEIGVHIQKVKS